MVFIVALVILLILACAWTGARIHEHNERQLAYHIWQRKLAGERFEHLWLPDDYEQHVRDFEAEAAQRGQPKEPATQEWSWYIDLD
jgi:hypothetical protein